VQGRKITGFTTQAEYDMGVMDGLRAWGEPMIDEHAKVLGAECKAVELIVTRPHRNADIYQTDVRSAGVWDDFHVVDGRVVTGMNPQSAKSTAKAVVQTFETL
jgi:putative intracellular protease/amidase